MVSELKHQFLESHLLDLGALQVGGRLGEGSQLKERHLVVGERNVILCKFSYVMFNFFVGVKIATSLKLTEIRCSFSGDDSKQ